jgi:hypothetical protein
MAEPQPQKNLKRVWIWILILICAAWIVYALTGKTSPPRTETGSDSGPVQQR